jgi:hypothetical protein
MGINAVIETSSAFDFHLLDVRELLGDVDRRDDFKYEFLRVRQSGSLAAGLT